jgi:hypothetical protein
MLHLVEANFFLTAYTDFTFDEPRIAAIPMQIFLKSSEVIPEII